MLHNFIYCSKAIQSSSIMSLKTALSVILLQINLLFLIHSAESSKCKRSFGCGDLGSLEFPLSQIDDPECGLFFIDGCNSPQNQTIHLGSGTRWNYTVEKNISKNEFQVRSPDFADSINNKLCFAFQNFSLPKFPAIDFSISPNLTLFRCLNLTQNRTTPEEFEHHEFEYYPCLEFSVYWRPNSNGYDAFDRTNNLPPNCSMIQLPFNPSSQKGSKIFDLLSADFNLSWTVSEECNRCHHGGGQCLTNSNNSFECNKGKSKTRLILLIAIFGGVMLLILCLLLGAFVVWQRKKHMANKKGYFLSRNLSLDPSLKTEQVGGSFMFGIPIFSYTELEEATNHFDPSKELGDGGYGTVYHGKLGDLREVAIKRMYEHNYKRLEQFMNEIKILTCLRHPNLVSLYGCTSRRSRELLLVYEYVPNGTVAEHLHGDRAKAALLAWDVRMSIAIETASALAYLHGSDIVHRDVKTSNILLDNDFKVKVADFGLSRLFPYDVTHISTAPQGTPGYVDPEYHRCYQLTDKSDVYSFGVVLIELVSSKQAVDISRQRDEINLADLAMNRIRKRAFDELVDPRIGYEADGEVRRMSMCVAELAFRCLQLEKELRPSMEEVLEVLMGVRSGEGFELARMVDRRPGYGSPETDDVVLLRTRVSSPNIVSDSSHARSFSTTASSVG